MSGRSELAIDGGPAVRETPLPYGSQWLEDDDIQSVVDTLRSEWLTTGPRIGEFERAFAAEVGAGDAVAVSNGTAALHAAAHAAGLGPQDEVVLPAMTFAATANCIVFQGATPVFADVDSETLLLDVAEVEAKITPRTKAIIAVDYAGQPCDYDALRDLAGRNDLVLIADACHALGGSYKGRRVGSLADLNTFSFHPVKHIATGEGGMITTDDEQYASAMRIFRNHGITADHHQRSRQGSWFYELETLGYNYRLTGFQCALGLSQLPKSRNRVSRRQEIARLYDDALAGISALNFLRRREDVDHAHHLYIVRLDLSRLRATRAEIFTALQAEGIGVNVHYIPVHLHPFYRDRFGTGPGLCPVAEAAYEGILSLPIFPRMTDRDAEDVVAAVQKVVAAYGN